jgi:hypothetical protein
MADKTSQINEIVQVMLNTWDMPPDCNEGELFTYAETLYDRIAAGESKDRLYAYLSEVQVDHLELAKSDDFRTIVDRAVARAGRPG